MSGNDLKRIEEIFQQALERPPDERQAFLENSCAGDAALRSEVESLLEAFEPSEAYFEDLSGSIARGAELEIEQARHSSLEAGSYRAIRLIGHGGMGAVYLAERSDGAFDRSVALKMLHLDMQHRGMRARFLAERQLLARLSHPRIARLLDGGLTEEGRPYFVMEYVEGRRITDYCRELDLESTLRLFLELVEAVSYLHRNLVVHRDLKPSNILVAEDGHVRLLDFGIARLLDGEEPAAFTRTATAERLLTPAYAAPEQSGQGAVTTATDVFSLGVLLYELLTGDRPFAIDPSGRPSFEDTISPPSSRLGPPSRTEGSGSRPTISKRAVAGDLDTICMMALRLEPERRYVSADQLGEDIESHLQGLPVRARKSTASYRFGKWLARHRIEAAAVTALLVLLCFGLIRERGLREIAERAQSEAQQEAMRAVAVSDFLGDLLSSVDPQRAQGREITVAEVLDDAAGRLAGDHALIGHEAAEAEVRLTLGRTYISLRRWQEAELHLGRALELREARQDELGRLEAIEAIGILAYRSGNRDQAEAPLLEALEGRRELLGEEHADTLSTMGHLANLYWYQERLDEAEQLDRSTLAIRTSVLGSESPDTLRALNGLATTLFARAHFDQAAPFFEAALAGQEAQLGPDHPDTLRTLNNLGATYAELGRNREAEPLQRRVVEGRARVLGEQAGATTTAKHNLGVTLYRLGKYEQAELFLVEARDRRKEHTSPNAWLFSQSFLADLYRDTGRFDQAARLYAEAATGQRENLGTDHQQTLRTEIGWAQLELRRGDLLSADARITKVISTQAEDLEPGHPDSLAAHSILCAIRIEQARPGDARELAEVALSAGKELLEPGHPSVEELRLQLARAWIAEGQLAEARSALSAIHSARKERLGEEHPATREALDLLELCEE